MKRLLLSMLLLVCISCREDVSKKRILDTDFDAAMGRGHAEYKGLCRNEYFHTFRKVFSQHRPSKVHSEKDSKIPKIIHQVWLEERPLPKAFIAFRSELIALHPEWEIRIWTAKEVASLDLEKPNKASSLEERTNSAKAAILDTFGGVIVDPDLELFSSLEELHKKYDFYGGFLPPEEHTSILQVSSSLLAARPGHPIIQAWRQKKQHTLSSLTDAAFSHIEDDAFCSIVFPPTYFCPISKDELSSFLRRRMTPIKAKIHSFMQFLHIAKNTPFSDFRPETVALSFWKGEVLKTPEERLIELAQQYNDLKEELHHLKENLQIYSQDVELTAR
jgi:hypothetical protein